MANAANELNQYKTVTDSAPTIPVAVSPTYDLNGNLTAYDNETFTYDVENRLTAYDSGAGVSVTYACDALGRRMKKTIDPGGANLSLAN